GPEGAARARAARPILYRRSSPTPPCLHAALASIPQYLSRLQRVLNAGQRPAFAAQLQERLALEVEQVLLADGRLVRQRTACEDVGERAPDHRVVIADPAGAPGEVDAELQRRKHTLAADGNRRARNRRTISFARTLERQRF